MKLEDKTIKFKSLPDNYKKEKSGLKPNTVRFTDDWVIGRWEKFYQAKFIKIINTNTKEHFIRKITDKTIYKNVVVISWEHPKR